jgi:hypothetical protein
MGNPLKIEVGGTITMDIKLNGAEWFAGAETGLTLMAGKQITDGINNFIKHGLKDARISTSSNWVEDQSTSLPMSGNSSGGLSNHGNIA